MERNRNIVSLANGISAFNGKNYLLAGEILNQYLNEENNRSFWARYYSGLALYQQGFVEEALVQWQNIITLGIAPGEEVRNRINQLYDSNLKRKIFTPRSFVKKLDANFLAKFNSLQVPLGLSLKDGELYFLEFKSGGFSQINLSEQTLAPVGIKSYFTSLRNPWDLVIDERAFIVSDFGNDKLIFFNRGNGDVIRVGERGNKDGEFLGPKGVALDEQKNVYVSESGNSRVQVFNERGEYLFKFGRSGDQAGEFDNPSGVIYDGRDRSIYVLDSGNDRIQKFNQRGEYLTEWGKDYLSNPSDFLLDGSRMFVLDEKQIYYQDLVNGESFPLLKNQLGTDDFFLSMAYDANQHIFYVSNLKNNKIEMFNPVSDRYQNLQVFFNSIALDDFPQVTLGVKVNNFYNEPIDFLEGNNFRVYENGVRVPHRKRNTPKEKRIVFLAEKSLWADRNTAKTRKFLDDFFSLGEDALIKVITFGNDNENGYLEKTAFNSLKLFITEKIIAEEKWGDLKIGRALNRAVTSLLSHSGKKAIVVLAYQKYPIRSFGGVGAFKKLAYYAKNNNIPIYAFYLGSPIAQSDISSNNFLANLTQDSLGELYLYDDSRKTARFYRHLNENGNNVYYLRYSTITNPIGEGRLRRVRVDVSYLGQKGMEDFIVYPIPR